jgi:hypothetical protein
VSADVQALPSSQVVPFVASGFVQVPPEQVPAVWHWSCALQTLTVPLLQLPFWHVSALVQRSPSSQAVLFALLGFEHCPVEVSHVPAV